MESAVVTVGENSQVGEARRVATAFADEVGMNETDRGRVALVVTEAANNLIQHGGGGEIVLQALPSTLGEGGVQILALDKGPGIAHLGDSLRDGHSTAGTAGEGLGAIRRQSQVFDVYSVPGSGTALLSHILPKPASPPVAFPWLLGVLSLPKSGETVCGDAWTTDPQREHGRFLVADGLGHGPLAAEASNRAVEVFGNHHDDTPTQLLTRIHASLRGTRGAAVACAFVDETTAHFAGVGNIAAAILLQEQMRGLASFNGTAGVQVYKIGELSYPFAPGSTLVMASDGVSASWRFDRYPGLLSRHPALLCGVLYRDCGRGRDDVTVLAARRATGDEYRGG